MNEKGPSVTSPEWWLVWVCPPWPCFRFVKIHWTMGNWTLRSSSHDYSMSYYKHVDRININEHHYMNIIMNQYIYIYTYKYIHYIMLHYIIVCYIILPINYITMAISWLEILHGFFSGARWAANHPGRLESLAQFSRNLAIGAPRGWV